MKRLLLIALWLVAGAVHAQSSWYPPTPQSQNYPSYVLQATTKIDALVLAASSAETMTVPTGSAFVRFGANCPVIYVRRNATAAVPGSDVTDGSASEINPAAWALDDVTTISVIAPTTCNVSFSWYKR